MNKLIFLLLPLSFIVSAAKDGALQT